MSASWAAPILLTAQTTSAAPPKWVVTTLAVVLGILLLAGWFAWDQWRNARLRALARNLGLRFHEHGPREVRLPRDFVLCRNILGDSPGMRWMMDGALEGVAVEVFEFRRIVDPNKQNTRGYPAVVVALDATELSLPDFVVQPERWRHKLLDATKGGDIDFSDAPDFSRRFRLRAPDETASRHCFGPEVRRFFEARRNLSAQSIEGKLFCFRLTRLFAWGGFGAKRIRRLVEDARALRVLLRTRVLSN